MIRYSMFENTRSNEPVMFESSWPDFVRTMREFYIQKRPATGVEKTLRTPMVSPAVYAPDATRKNQNVEAFGSWFALDMDNGLITVAEAATILEAVPTDYMIWTTTSSQPHAEKYRIAFPLDRDVLPEETKAFWGGVHAFFGNTNDIQTKDPARIFAVPATWEGSAPQFISSVFCDRCVCVDEMLTYAPAEETPTPLVVTKSQREAIRRALAGQGKSVEVDASIYSSKAVHARFVEQYLNLPKGDHHRGLYRFMSQVADRALYFGMNITPANLVDFARQLDAISPVKTAKSRWSRISGEAATALRWAHQTYIQKEILTDDQSQENTLRP